MGLSIPDVRFELNAVYKTYADQLFLAGKVSGFLLDSANIDAAGGQVEGSLRILLQNLLPDRVSVSHGHLVDKNASVSNQQDVLIAESFFTKSLIKSLDGTEFYPVEAIFATGEVKKTWSQQNLQSAIKSINRTKNELSRKEILPTQLSTGSNFITLSDPITLNPKRNPFFCFTFSLDYSRNYNEKKLAAIYKDPVNIGILPNIAVVLSRGIYVMVDEGKMKKGELNIKLYPEFNSAGVNCRWIMVKLKPEEALAYLVFMLTQHINDTVLEKVSAMDYAQTMITIPSTNISPL
jgi:hypothetical protein